MPNDVLDAVLVRNGTYGSCWLDGEQAAEVYGLQAKIHRSKESVNRCRTPFAGKKVTSMEITGSLRIYNATNRMLEAEAAAFKAGRDLQHTVISSLDDPDNPQSQRIALYGVSFDDLTLADWEAAKLGQIECPFTASGFEWLS